MLLVRNIEVQFACKILQPLWLRFVWYCSAQFPDFSNPQSSNGHIEHVSKENNSIHIPGCFNMTAVRSGPISFRAVGAGNCICNIYSKLN